MAATHPYFHSFGVPCKGHGTLLGAPFEKTGGYPAYRTAIHKTQPRLFELGHIQPVEQEMAFGSGSSFSTDRWTRRIGFPSSVQLLKVGKATLLHQHSSSKPTAHSGSAAATLIIPSTSV